MFARVPGGARRECALPFYLPKGCLATVQSTCRPSHLRCVHTLYSVCWLDVWSRFICSGGKQQKDVDDDYERAQMAIAKGVGRLEHAIQEAVEEEVHLMFPHPRDEPRKASVAAKASEAVRKAAERARADVKRHVSAGKESKAQHPEHRIMHAIESAEKAVLHAVQDEVDVLFHSDEHKHDEHAQKAKKAIKKRFHDTKKKVEDSHKERRKWMKEEDRSAVQEYLNTIYQYQAFN